MFKTKKNKFNLPLISKVIQGNKLTLSFQKPEGFTYEAGQYATFILPELSVMQGSREFSFASTPHEDVIMIGTQLSDPPSKFKQALKEMKEGDSITMKGPFGDFLNTDHSVQKVFLGLGIGITPIRSIFLNTSSLDQSTLIYSGRGDLLFMDELVNLKEKGLTVLNPKDRHELADVIDSLTIASDAEFYISGSMQAVTSVSKQLKSKKVKASQMFSDVFTGY